MSGIPCPQCATVISAVHGSRVVDDRYVRRRRNCKHCKHRWSTIEVSLDEFNELQAVKTIRAEARTELRRALNALDNRIPEV
jgi:transcriptional regulator NrdR family protein